MTGYKVQVEGEYFARSGVMGSERVLKNYVIEANLATMDRALSVVKNKILRPALALKYDDYIAPRTQHITKITPLDEASKKAMRSMAIMYMDRPTLLQYIEENNLPVDVDLYPDLFKLREAAEQAKIDPEKFSQKQEANRANLTEDLVLASLNPNLFPKGEREALVPVLSNTKPANPNTAKALPKEQNVKQIGDRVAGLAAEQIRTGEMGHLDNESDI